jgi:scyllo-inositol 2-dehydrogenase (NADP+)
MIGYGGAFNMGRAHSNMINAVDGMITTAVCDVDKARTKQAEEDFPGIKTYNAVADLLKDDDVDLCVVILPHNIHAEVAVQCSKAGKHVITEKPMCITVKQATQMIDAAAKAGKMLSVYHNRRRDGDFKAILHTVQSGIIGDVFHVEMWMGGYHGPRDWWRADKEISGGAFYDWGAHFLDWLLQVMPGKIEYVTGHYHKLVWHEMTNEDHVEAIIKFDTGAVANVQQSMIAAVGKPRWRILGTEGALVHVGDHLELYTFKNGYALQGTIPFEESDYQTWYNNIGDHLLRGGDLMVKPEQARRVIGIIECAEKSSATGKAVKVPYEE